MQTDKFSRLKKVVSTLFQSWHALKRCTILHRQNLCYNYMSSPVAQKLYGTATNTYKSKSSPLFSAGLLTPAEI